MNTNVKKCFFGGALLGAGLCSNAQADSVNFSGVLDVLVSSYGGYNYGSYAYNYGQIEVDTFSFSVTTAGYVTIDALSYGVFSTYFDPMLYLFNNDGNTLGYGNYITYNDDSVSDGNGSISSLDSFISVFLGVGDYTIAIGAYSLSVNDVTNGYNYAGVWSIDGFIPTSGMYEIDVTGDGVSVTVVPLPPAAFGGLAMLAGLGAYRRVRR